MNAKLREALNQLLGLIDNEILIFNSGLTLSEISNAQYQIDEADKVLKASENIGEIVNDENYD